MNGLTTFTYSAGVELRTAVDAGETIVCLADLAHGLGIKHVATVRRRLPEGVVRNHPLPTPGGTQNATFVTEAGMNMVIWRSDKPEAVAYARWCAERIAELRKGNLSRAPQLTGKELLAAAVLEAAETIKQQEAQLAAQREQLDRALPKANTWDAICSGRGDHTITDAAKLLSSAGVVTGPRKLHAQLQDLGWIHKDQRGRWAAYQDRLNAGLLAEKARHYLDDDGVMVTATPQVRVTPKGLQRLRELLAPIDAPQLAVLEGGLA